MYFLVFLVSFFVFISGENYNKTGVKYYFKLDKPLTEFKVLRRVNGDYNVSVVHYKGPENLRKASFENEADQKDLFLDEEWNYNFTERRNGSELPTFFEIFYETRSKKLHHINYTTTRFLFNENQNLSTPIIKFNLESLMDFETITAADFYFYWPLENTSEIYRTSVVLRLYQIEEGKEMDEKKLLKNPDIHKLLNVIYISKAQKGWQNFKVKKAFLNWGKEPNLGLLLTISAYGENRTMSIFNDRNFGKFRSFTVVHLMENGTIPEPEITPEQLETLTKPGFTSILNHSSQCQRKSWYIDFKRLGWDVFVIFPNGFTAFDCYGKCSAKNNETINHIKLLQYLRQRVSHCVPTNYLPLPIMFFDKFGNVVLKNYEKMVATECGCR